jgi:Cof subfamily protein (haloacid dehalogenase superfamily)
MRPRLLALDLDGTLMTYDNRLPMGHVHAVRAIQRLGVTVAICTGRSLKTTRWIWEALGLDSPLVCFNGSWVGLPDHPPIAQAGIAGDEVQDLLVELMDRDGAVCCYPDPHSWVMSRHLPRTQGWSRLYGIDIEIDADRIGAWSELTFKVMYVDEPDIIRTVTQRLRERFGRRFQVHISQEDRVEVLPPHVNKGWGLQALAAHLGVDRADVWAAGDADNDKDMLAWAGHPCVMGQAEDRLLEMARHRLPSNEARGLCALVPLFEQDIAAEV